MRIDDRIEEHVREAYRGVAGRDSGRVMAALRGLNDDEVSTALSYALFVCACVVSDVFPRGPSDDDLLAMARGIVEDEKGWIDLGDPRAVAALLASAHRGDQLFPGTPKGDLAGLLFVCGANLLHAYRSDGQDWWDYLDQIWARLESTEARPG